MLESEGLVLYQEILALLEKLRSFKREEKAAALQELINLNRNEVICVLSERLNDPDTKIQGFSAEALAQIDPERGIPLILPLLDSPDATVRWLVCGLIFQHGNEQFAHHLVKVVQDDPDGDVRHLAAFALGKIGNTAVIPVLEHVSQHDTGTDFEGRRVGVAAADAIEEILNRQ